MSKLIHIIVLLAFVSGLVIGCASPETDELPSKQKVEQVAK